MSGHTPGPWFASEDDTPCPDHKDSGLAIIDTGRMNDFTIAQHVEWNNARLIAAAPELLESLQDLVAQVDENAWILKELAAARAAISKATGQVGQ